MKISENIIVIGGPIAAGKSTLVGSLPFKPVQELDPNDELQRVLIDQMYEGDPIAAQVFQLDMLLNRFDKYKNAAKNKSKKFVFDRLILEDRLFAYLLLSKRKNVWQYYDSIWKDKMDELVNEIGKPKLYILLTMNWDTFMERIFERNRSSEINNFERNETYFKKMLDMYEAFCVDLFKKFDIPYVIINTDNKNKVEVINETKKILKEKGIL